MKFQLGDTLVIAASDEDGECIGRAEYARGEPSYLLRYCAADGRAVEAWWNEGALRLGNPIQGDYNSEGAAQ